MDIKQTVSVLIPTYNYSYLIDQAIDSILAQTYENYELIICDDCSEDDTEEIVRNYHDPRISFYRNEKRLGLYGNFNNSRRYASGDYLLFLCADDLLSPESLKYMVKALDFYPSAALATTYQKQGIDAFGNKMGNVVSKRLGPGLVKGKDVILGQCRFVGSVGRPSEVLIRANLLPHGDTFDRSVEHCADNALWCTLCEKWDVVYVQGAIAYIRSHNQQATKYHEKILLDIKNSHDMFERLFRDSTVLQKRPWYKYILIITHFYPWFNRALHEAYKGEWKRCIFIMQSISTFSKIPWWLAYFLFLKYAEIIKKTISKIRKR
jgi:glycosyltransferase involved in cell wall biosynthesis